MATLTGLEPATSTVTGWRASDCSTGPIYVLSGAGLNRRPPLYQSGALNRLSYRTSGTPCGTRTRSAAVKEQETNPYPNGAWCRRRDSNSQPPGLHSGALPDA